jgi:hypothetical protein
VRGIPALLTRTYHVVILPLTSNREVWSETGMGTEVALTIPADAAYATPRPGRQFWPFAGRTQS